MRTQHPDAARAGGLLLVGTILVATLAGAQSEVVAFDSDRWAVLNGEVVEHLGRQSLVGSALLKDVELVNGVVEVDVAVTGERSYPGFAFRMQSPADYEHFYIRPHRESLYPDAVQYAPTIGGVGCWQLYNGPGYTADAAIPAGEWLHLKLEVHGRQARLFIGDSARPALVVHDLKRGVSKGTVGVIAPPDGTAFFSNFRYRPDDGLHFDPPPPVDVPPGLVTEWQLSAPVKTSEIDPELYPGAEQLAAMEWQEVRSAPSGLLDFAPHVRRSPGGPDSVFARTTIRSETAGIRKYRFGYSDVVSIFINGQIVFSGASAYRQRDPSFLGIVGLFDAVYLPLRQGDNELLLVVTEVFGGWGLIWQDGEAVFHHQGIEPSWETAEELLVPESVLYDPVREVLYVSNLDPGGPPGEQYLSKVSLGGQIEALRWATGLRNPTGMALAGERLFAVERTGLAEIDPTTGEVIGRHAAAQPGFLNDVAADDAGTLYVSDSRQSVVYRVTAGQFEPWLSGDEIASPNGLEVYQGHLVVGNNGDQSLKFVRLGDGTIDRKVRLGPGTIDGIGTDADGNLIVSHWEGRVFRITPAGEVVKLLDTTVVATNTADLEVVADQGLVVIPTFGGNRVVAYRLTD